MATANPNNWSGTIQLTAGGAVTALTIDQVNNCVGVYMNDGVANDVVPFMIQGAIKDAPKLSGTAWNAGDAVWWDDSNNRFTKVNQGGLPDGIAMEAAASGATTARVYLTGAGAIGLTEDFGATGIKADVIAESTSAAGVTVDGVLLKDGGITLADAANVIVGTTTGTKIGTATAQKLGFWNATPIVQPAAGAQAALTDNSGGSGSTVPLVGNTMAGNEAANINNGHFAIVTLLHAIRTALVNSGIIKGSA